MEISIHVPREGHDEGGEESWRDRSKFQSTCPARGTTTMANADAFRQQHFNPRAPRGARPTSFTSVSVLRRISIHVPREGHDSMSLMDSLSRNGFQSTCPARGTTAGRYILPRERHISIHVPREGHDGQDSGEVEGGEIFQSTCPARGTTRPRKRARGINPHFNPRAPRGARLHSPAAAHKDEQISIHVPREGHDLQDILTARAKIAAFQSTCPARGTTLAAG